MVAAQDVARVVVPLDGRKALVGRRRVGGRDVRGGRRLEEADVGTAAVDRDVGPGSQRLGSPLLRHARRQHHARHAQELGVPVRERRRVWGGPPERTAQAAQLNR